MLRRVLGILVVAAGAAVGQPPGAAEATVEATGIGVVSLLTAQPQRLAIAQRQAYDQCLLAAATQLDPKVAQLPEAARAALLERLTSQWASLLVASDVVKMTTDARDLRLTLHCVFRRQVLADALAPQVVERLVLITGPQPAARRLEQQAAQRLTAAGYPAASVVALDPSLVAQWREAAGRDAASVLFLYAQRAKVHRVLLGRLELTTTGELLAGRPLFLCKAQVAWRLIDSTTGKIEQARTVEATGDSPRRADAETRAVDGAAEKLAADAAAALRLVDQPVDAERTIYLRLADVRFSHIRLLNDQLGGLPSVERARLIYFTRQIALYSLQLAEGATADALAADLGKLAGLKIEIGEKKGNEWSCTIVQPDAPQP